MKLRPNDFDNAPVEPENVVRVKTQAARIFRHKLSQTWRYAKAAMLTSAVAVVTVIEGGVLFKIFFALKGANVPSDSNIEVVFMVASGALMIAGYHFARKIYGATGLLGLLDRMAKTLIPIYFIGAAALFVTVMTTDVAVFLSNLPSIQETISSGEWRSEAAQAVVERSLPAPIVWIVKNLLPYAGMLFGFGAAGLALVALFIANHLIDALTKTITEIIKINQLITSFAKPYRQWKADLKELMKISAERKALAAISKTELHTSAVHGILGDIQAGIRSLDYWHGLLTGYGDRKKQDAFTHDFESSPPDGIKPEFLKGLIGQLKAITPQKVSTIITTKIEPQE